MSATGTLGLMRGARRYAALLGGGGLARRAAPVARHAATRAWSPRRQRGSASRWPAARADSARRADALRIEQLALGMPVGVGITPGHPAAAPARFARGLAHGVRHAPRQHQGARRGRARGQARASCCAAARYGGSVRPSSGTDVTSSTAPLRFRASADSVEATGRTFERVAGRGHVARQAAHRQVRSFARTRSCRTRRSALVRAAGERDAGRAAGFAARELRHARVASRARGRVRLDHGIVAVDSIDLRSSGGRPAVRVRARAEERADALDVAAENVRIATRAAGAAAGRRRRRRRRAPRARLSGHADAAGGGRAGDAADGELARQSARPMRTSRLGYRDRRVGARAMAHDSTGRRVLAGTARCRYDLALESVERFAPARGSARRGRRDRQPFARDAAAAIAHARRTCAAE